MSHSLDLLRNSGESNPELAKKNNVRDFATINELTVMSNLETHNAELIKRGMEKNEGIDSLLFLVYSSDITYSMLHFCTDM